MRRLAVSLAVVAALILPGCARNEASKEAFCRQLRRTPSLAEVFSGYAIDGPDTLRRKMRDAAAEFSSLERSAPRQIRASVGSVANLVDEIVETVEESPDDPVQIAYRLRQKLSTNTGAVKAVSKVADYAMRECGIDLNSPLFGTGAPDSELYPGSPPDTFPGMTAPFGTPP